MSNENIFYKKVAKTNPAFGSDPYKRSVKDLINYGIINLNKPSGPTSHQTVDYVKKILNLKKAGHSGTLDPKVTGVLVIATGKATRIVQHLLTSGKEYVCLMHLHKPVNEQQIIELMNDFIGEIEQLPPIRSAVKRQLRKRNIYELKVLEISGQDVLFKMSCQAGTYVRKFVHDFGQRLGVNAHMVELVRTRVAMFKLEDSVTLHDLKDAYTLWHKHGNDTEIRKCVKPVETAVQHLPKVWVNDTTVDSLAHGASLSVPGVVKLNNFNKNETIAVLTLKNELVMVGKALMSSKGVMENDKGLAVKAWKVFMDKGVYPKFVKK